MTLEFENTFDDILTFNIYNYRTSPTLRRPHQLARIMYPIISVVSLIGFYVYFGGRVTSVPFLGLLGLVVVASIGWYVAYPSFMHRRIRTLTTRLLRESKNTSLTERCSISIDNDGLHFAAPSSSGHIGWNLIQRVDVTPQYIYLYMNAMSAIVIPRRSVNSDAEWDTVQQTIKRYEQRDGDTRIP